MHKDEELTIIPSSGNVFEDLDFKEPKRYLAKVQLAMRINSIIKTRKLTQKEAAKLLGVNQPKVSQLSTGDLDGFSMERLLSFLNRLDQTVDIIVRDKPKRSRKPAAINIAFV